MERLLTFQKYVEYADFGEDHYNLADLKGSARV